MKQVTAEEVDRLAKLSELEFSDAETAELISHVQKMLGYFETLDSLNLADVPPTAHILDRVNELREDVPEPSFSNDELLSNAPESDNGAYVVPRVVE